MSITTTCRQLSRVVMDLFLVGMGAFFFSRIYGIVVT
jgi:hypothetical protein